MFAAAAAKVSLGIVQKQQQQQQQQQHCVKVDTESSHEALWFLTRQLTQCFLQRTFLGSENDFWCHQKHRCISFLCKSIKKLRCAP
ncbi:uncharacterized protein V6R79_017568 [Siganus canaliculatus]